MKRIKVFVSYSHIDKKYFDTFMIHLKGLERLYNVTHWIDGEIRAGENIDDTVLKNLNESDIVFILISPNYIQSYYCYEKEMEHAFQRQTEGRCVVIPIIIKETANIDQFEFSKYKMLPVDARPVSNFRSISDGFSNVMKEMFPLIQDYFKKNTPQNNKKPKSISQKTKSTFQNKFFFQVVSRGKIINKSFDSELYLELQNYLLKKEVLEKRLSAHLVNSIIQFQKKYETEKAQKNYVKWHSKDLQAYSLQLLEYTKKILDNNIIAIHIRWLKNKCFVSFVDAGYKENSALSVRALPEDDPMITNAYTLNLPVIKSLNTQLHKKNHKLEGNQRDYITCAFKSIKSKVQAELTLCISCEKTRPIDSQKQLLIMAFCRIDKTIESFLLSYIEACAEIDKRYSLKKIGDKL